MNSEVLQQIREARAQRKPVALVTALDDGRQRVVGRDHDADDVLAPVLEEAFRFDRSGVHRVPEGEFFVNIYNPPLRLVIIGAVHIAQALIVIAQSAGYDAVVIDPRGAFATAERFPDVTVHADWPDEVLPGVGVDARTAFVALTHDPKIDDPAIHAALRSRAFYIGALGSKKTHATRVARLKQAGFSDDEIGRIHAPIGIDIGAQGPAEIAIAIMAQITSALRRGSTQ
jgi:xanthine dehydrogenase accessory factor